MKSDDLFNRKDTDKSINNCSECFNKTHTSLISDTGASIHVTNDETGIVNKHTFRKDHLKYANKNTDIIEFYGDLLCRVFDSNYNSINVIIRNVSYVPTCDNKIFSGTQVCNNDFMKGIITGTNMIYSNDDISLYFQRNCESNLLVGHIEPIKGNGKQLNRNYSVNKINKININTFHDILGHPNEKVLRNTAKILGIKPEGDLEVCDSCSLSKARRKDLNKINTHKSNIPGERIYADISYVNSLSLGKKRFWILFVDEYSRFKWSNFVERKSDFISTSVSRLRELIYMKFNLKYLIIDKSGENIKLKSYLINNINCHSIRNINI